ncbi:Blood-induced peptide 1 [Candida viswanathii]|uniref:Blood-induced peptide 1 n=1 Tax=Candida viswanathii TaxID=5486 RepID=A0A367YB95_9ASCO|nr:Blood-induced peptide 1 [Candida viswanathii]
MSYDADRKRKLSQEEQEETMKKVGEDMVMAQEEEDEDDAFEDDDEEEEDEEEGPTLQEMVSRDRANSLINEFINNEKEELRRMLKEVQQENESLKKILKRDYNVSYHAVKKDYEM